ncbi:MAG: flavodoxin family protein [Anaerolineaceae bacterium]|nr:flavodoxin family protein [Anaerolineaceae bacterium]
MKTIVIYDSMHGNTEKIARAIGEGLGAGNQVVNASQASAAMIVGYDLVVIGSPTHGGRPTKPLQAFLDKVPYSDLIKTPIAVFDTRFYKQWVKIFGFAANRMSKNFKKQGLRMIDDPQPFFVMDTEGPLQERELERAVDWGKTLAGKV